MWFIGLIVGAIIGAIGDKHGALIGALFGAAIGWAFSQKLKTAGEERLAGLEASIRILQERVRLLENASHAPERSGPLRQIHNTDLFQSGSEAPRASDAGDFPVTPSPSASDSAAQIAPGEERPSGEVGSMFEPARATVDVTTAPSPRQPSPVWNFFFGGNTLVRIGVIVLFFGVGFLLKYASEHIEISIEVRLVGVALGAIVMLATGWRLRRKRPGYGLILQGGGIGLLYLTVFAAFRLYQLLPAGPVLALLAAMAIFSATLALLQDSPSLAAMGVTGGFLAPLLASTGGGSHVMLFSFYALINFGILLIAWFKAWRSLNLLGFAFTFVIGLLWGARYYRSELFASTEPFLILFFLFYVTIAVLFALRQEASIKSRVDGTLVFGTPLIAFGLQTALVQDIEYGAAFSALGLGFFYWLMAKLLFARASDNVRLLVDVFIALGVVFGTLAIPLAFDGRWTAAAWALEGAAIVWIGVRQEKIGARAFGISLQAAAGIAFLVGVSAPRAVWPVFNSIYLGCIFISFAGLFCAYYLRRHRARVSDVESAVALLLFCWGVSWWLGGGFNEIDEHVTRVYRLHSELLLVVASCAIFSMLHFRIDWREAKYAALALAPLMYLLAAAEIDEAAHPFQYFGFIAWPVAFAAHLWLLRRHEETQHVGWWHAAGVWLFGALSAWELGWWIGDVVHGGDVWRLIGWPVTPVALLAWLSDQGERIDWPVTHYTKAYQFDGLIPLAGFIWLWMLHANFTSRGDPEPLPYLPLLNPLDIMQFAALMALFAWFRQVRSAPFAPPLFRSGEIAYVGLGSAAFLWLNGVLLRTLHHWAGVPFQFDAMMRSMMVQASFSIFWSTLALCAMLTATHVRARPLWLTGAGLMAVVVIKLFFIDLSNIGGIERIVSFIGVGVLLLVIGYVSPVPPSVSDSEAAEKSR
ncbi:MAG TPA: DUF2339 domain-containing protein [Candidatus Binatia bacterium]|jgi:uncharacterized membrane protein|nr:DUF2339 domain-containing protein [Candidatus Binatia bacterium]